MNSNLLKAALLASGAALVFGAAAPAQADPVLSGYVDAWAALGSYSESSRNAYYYGGEPTDDTPCDNDTNICAGHYHDHFNMLGGDGRAAIQWNSGFGIQLDAQGSDANFHDYGDGYDSETTDLAAHFFQRSDDMLWGGFASIGGTDDARFGTVGAEFQEYWNDWTFYGQASWSKGLTSWGSEDHNDSWNFNVQARYFVSSHLLLTGGVGFDTGGSHWTECCEAYYHFHQDNWNWTLRAEWLMDNLPISIFGEYDGSYSHDRGHIDSSDGEGYAVNSRGRTDGNLFMIGVRLFLNQQDLMTNDRTGASLEDFNPWTGKYSTMGQFDDGNGAY
jgi:hypothetical protein